MKQLLSVLFCPTGIWPAGTQYKTKTNGHRDWTAPKMNFCRAGRAHARPRTPSDGAHHFRKLLSVPRILTLFETSLLVLVNFVGSLFRVSQSQQPIATYIRTTTCRQPRDLTQADTGMSTRHWQHRDGIDISFFLRSYIVRHLQASLRRFQSIPDSHH